MKENICKYLNNTIQTMNGVIYKNDDAFKNKKGICYISEYALEDLESSENDMTDEEIVEEGIGDTYDTILSKVKENWEEIVEEYGDEYTEETFAELVYQESDWAYVATTIEQLIN